jgi:anti-sigma factor RsiW
MADEEIVRMNAYACAEWQDALSAYLDGELQPHEEQQMHVHLRQCSACTEALVDLVPLVQALRALPERRPVRDLWPHVAAELRHDPAFFSRRLRPRLPQKLVLAAVGAALLGAGVAVLQTRPQPMPVRSANLETYWQQHALFGQAQGTPGRYMPTLSAVDAERGLVP